MTVKQNYEVGDTVWIYGVSRIKNKITQGRVVKVIDLSDIGYTNVNNHYLIEIPTEIEPLLEIRTWHTISQDQNGPVGSLRNIPNVASTMKSISQLGYEYDLDSDPDDPTPEQIHAALEKSQKDASHGPLVLKDAKPKRRNFTRKKKV
jgi:hypothetical protein